MVIFQVGYAVVNVFYKLAANDGMSFRVLAAYRFIFATAFMLPLALFLERYAIYIYYDKYIIYTALNNIVYQFLFIFYVNVIDSGDIQSHFEKNSIFQYL